jgi:hypothetical protein
MAANWAPVNSNICPIGVGSQTQGHVARSSDSFSPMRLHTEGMYILFMCLASSIAAAHAISRDPTDSLLLPSYRNSFMAPFFSLTIASYRCFPGTPKEEDSVYNVLDSIRPILFFQLQNFHSMAGLSRCLPPRAVVCHPKPFPSSQLPIPPPTTNRPQPDR